MMIALALATALVLPPQKAPVANAGDLVSYDKAGKPSVECPLLGTTADAMISGFGAEVKVVQTFRNPSKTPIEAVYTFPLPEDAAVNRMRIQVGTRVIEGVIKRREEARRIYDAAKNAGQAAALLDQERPNIFTQSVANIMPNAEVKVEITYVQMLKYENSQFEFSFPMVVGPRFLGNAPDPGKISPPITPPGTRTGAGIAVNVDIDAGTPIVSMESVLHDVVSERQGKLAKVSLKKKGEIPNRDFILRYRVATDAVKTSLISHFDKQKGGFFSLAIVPPKTAAPNQIRAREIIFVMDQSGSQSGFPIIKSKELTLKMIKTLRPADTFNVMGFNTSVRALWPNPKAPTAENLAEAERFVTAMQANGGTHIREGVVAALDGQNDPRRLRIVLFNTDGYVGDEKLILDTIQKRRDRARMFTFGIGNSVNRFLIEAMSTEGKGAAEYVTLAEGADKAVSNFMRRTRTPVLTNITVRFDGGLVSESSPEMIPDVFDGQPIVIHGRYRTPGSSKAVITGMLGGQPWSQTVDLKLGSEQRNPALLTLFARKKVDDLTRENWLASMSVGDARPSTEEKITEVALEFGIMSEYTSFVAVEPRVINVGGKSRTVHVPVEMADGVSYEMADGQSFSTRAKFADARKQSNLGRNVRAGGGASGGMSAGAPRDEMKSAETRQDLYTAKVSRSLREAKGKVEVMVWLSAIDDSIVNKLKALGLTVSFRDDKLRILFGTCDAKVLKALSELAPVDAIRPIE